MTRTPKPFKLALGLWVSPDFSQVLAGRAKPPRVNHLKLDFLALRDALISAFQYGPHVEILVPNDSIDQVTLHTRAGMLGTQAPDVESTRCSDFGAAMLRCVQNSKDGVIDVRAAWQPLHATPVKDRAFAPPPVILPFVVLASDFEDAQIFAASCRPVLGLPVFDPIKAVLGQDHGDPEGTLPESLRLKLKEIFDTPFERSGLLDRMAMDRPPKEYGLDNL